MKGTNTILSILVVLMAAALAWSSYMLFEKRNYLADGWNMQAKTLEAIAQKIDEKSGTINASEISAANMNLKKNPDLKPILNKATQAIDEVMAQRDAMASNSVAIANALSMPPPSEQSLLELSTYDRAQNEIKAFAQKVITSRDSVIDGVINLARMADENANENSIKDELSNGNISSLSSIENYINSLEKKLADCQDGIVSIAAVTDTDTGSVKSAPKSVAAKIKKDAQSIKDDRDSARKAAALKDAQIKKQSEDIKDRDNQIGVFKTTIKGKDEYIAQLKQTLNTGDGVLAEPWTPGSFEARCAVSGKVVSVNKEFGFFVVDFGSASVVTQDLGKKTNTVNPKITSGMTVVISRNMKADVPDFVSKAKLSTVRSLTSIIEAKDAKNPELIKVGDYVYFAEEDLK